MAGTKVNFPDEDRCSGVHGVEFDRLSCDMCLDGLQVVDYEMIDSKCNDNSIHVSQCVSLYISLLIMKCVRGVDGMFSVVFVLTQAGYLCVVNKTR